MTMLRWEDKTYFTQPAIRRKEKEKEQAPKAS
jgi:bis(5'-nucleosyl)-tetraphosphatase (symmetrical)